jgi:hypothetical protein
LRTTNHTVYSELATNLTIGFGLSPGTWIYLIITYRQALGSTRLKSKGYQT